MTDKLTINDHHHYSFLIHQGTFSFQHREGSFQFQTKENNL